MNLLLAMLCAAAPVTVTRLDKPEKALRYEAVVSAPVDEVWKAFTTKEGLQTWLWRDAKVDLREGGDWLVLYPEGKTGGGTILSFEAKSKLVLSAMAPEWFPNVRAERTHAVFEFAPAGPGETRVTLTQTGWKQGKEWDDAYEYLSKGNAQLLAQLQRRFEKGPIDWSKLK
jgi:uncharacterized protein YndB with AHSA1/START domain